MGPNRQTTTDRKSTYTSAGNQRVTTYRSVILIHEVVNISCGVTQGEHLNIGDHFERVGCEVAELGHWLGLSVESRQGAPGNSVVMQVATSDKILSGGCGNEEGELRSLQYRLISEGEGVEGGRDYTQNTT